MAETPRQFHFVFGLKPQTEPFHIVFFLCLESCRRVNRPESIHFHYHYEPYGPWWERIRPHLTLHRVDPVSFVARSEAYWEHQEGTFIKQAGLDYAHQSDFIRLQVLLEQGGVYADIDTLFINPLPDELYRHEFVLGSEGEMQDLGSGRSYQSLCNALILSRAGARFGRRWLEDMYKLFDGTWDRHSCYGASMLAEEMPDAVHVAPRKCFYRYRWTREDIALLLEGVDRDHNDICSVHLWNHLWWEPSRTDFSRCHKGLLTEDYIRAVDTTYNLLARRFLD
ncbi:MAG TPA: glycosyltransferase [Arenicellales bacterium]|nr:glycosyltransferase [Arenicellales bacterium]